MFECYILFIDVGISATLSATALFRSEIGTYCNPKDLYDPDVQFLQSLLPQEVFPSSVLFSEPWLLRSLRTLGMHSSITAQGVLTAARNVQTSLFSSRFLLSHTTNSGLSSSENNMGAALDDATQQKEHENMHENEHEKVLMAEILGRAVGLLQYIEFNIEALLHTEDPEGLQRARGRILLTSEVQDTNSDNLNSEGGCKKENDNDSDNSPIAKGNFNDDLLL